MKMGGFFPIKGVYKKGQALKILKENLHNDYKKNLEIEETVDDGVFGILITQKEYTSDRKNLEASECFNYVSGLNINDIVKKNK